jgi:transcriptional regulator with XRE-family HTH domain
MSPVNVTSIGAYIREQREQARISLRQLAQNAGISNPYLSQIERGLRRPSADILQQIAKGLRISAEALYVQAGFLEDKPPGSMVREAILIDPELTERQRQMLVEIYDSFRKETALALAADAADDEDEDDESGLEPDPAALLWPEDVDEEALEAAPGQRAIAADPVAGDVPSGWPGAAAEPPAAKMSADDPAAGNEQSAEASPAHEYPRPPANE